MADWRDQVTAAPPPAAPAGNDWRSQVVPATVDDPTEVHPAIASLVKNAPGMTDAKNPMEGFFAGLQMGASVLPFHKPNMQVPANASFGTRLAAGIGQTVTDLPASVAGFVAGAAAGGGAGAAVPGGGETGVTEAGGVGIGAYFGTTAVPQAVRETMMDYYQDTDPSRAPMTAADFFHQVATSAWNVTKAGVVGIVGGKVGEAVGGAAAGAASANEWSSAGTSFAKAAGTATGFTAGATAAQAGLEGRVPDAQDFTIAAITGLGFGVAGHYVGGGFKLSDAGEQYVKNQQKVYAETGVPPWEQTARATNDPVLKQELLSHDVNGDPVATKFNQTRQPDPEPFHEAPDAYTVKDTGPKSALTIKDEHEAQVSEIETQAHAAAHAAQLLPKVKSIETGGQKNPDLAISPTGAVGRYQIQPGTARQYGFDPEKLTDPKYNEMVAKTILTDLSRRFHGDTEAVLAAYNAGPGRAMRWVRDGKNPNELPVETQKYLIKAGFGGKGGEPPEPPEKPPAVPQGEPGPNGKPTGPDYTKLSTDNLVARLQDKIGEPPAPKVTGFGGMMRMFVSELESARGVDKELQRRGLLDPKTDISTEDMFRQTYASADRAKYFFVRGGIDPVTLDHRDTPPLTAVLKEIAQAGGNIDEYNTYRIAQRTLEKAEQGINVGVLGEGDIDTGRAEAGAILQKPEMQKYKEIDQTMQAWKNSVLEYGRDSGLFSQSGMEAMQALNTSHVSIRAIQGGDFGPDQGNVGNFKVRNPLQRMVGGAKGQIVDPLIADMDNAERIIRMADRNRAVLHVLGAQDIAEFWGLKKVGELPKMAIAEPGSDVFKPFGLTPEEEAAFGPIAVKEGTLMGKNSFLAIRNGVGEVWTAANPDVAQLMRGMDSQGEANIIEKILRLPAALERAGITAAPDFVLRVPMAHQLNAWALAPNHPPPYITALRGIVQAFKGDGDDFWELMRRGGLSGSISEADMAKHIDRALGDQDVLHQTGALQKVWNTVAHPLHFAQIISEKVTQAERIGHFQYAKGKNPELSPNKIAMQGRVAYLDFAEKGTAVLANKMAQFIPFWRSTMLGVRGLRNAVVDDPKKFAMYTAAGIVLPQIGLYALNRAMDQFLPDKDKYSSIPQWERDQFYITPPLGPDGVRIKLRRAFTIGPMVGVPIERYLESAFEKNPNAFDGVLSAMFSDVTPSLMPQAALPAVEAQTNHNFFTGKQLIPDRVRDASPDLQYNDYTSEVSKKISAAIGTHQGLGIYNVSPIVLDNYVEEWGGTIGKLVLHSLDKPLGKESGPSDLADVPFVQSFVVRHPEMNTQELDDFYKDATNFTQTNKDAILERKLGNPEQAAQDKSELGQKVSLIYRIEHALAVQRTAIKAINENKTMTVDDKRQLSDRIYNDAWSIAHLGRRALKGGADMPTMDEAQKIGDQATANVKAAMPNGEQ